MGEDDLHPYVTLALAERLERAKHSTSADAEERIRVLDAALRHEGRAAASLVAS